MRNCVPGAPYRTGKFQLFTKKCADEKAPSVKARELMADFLKNLAKKGFAVDKRLPSLHRKRGFKSRRMFSSPGGIGIALNRTHSSKPQL